MKTVASLLKTGEIPDSDKEEVTAYSGTVTYVQNCDENRDNTQELLVSLENNGAGSYYVLKTERWAINDVDELINVLNDFKLRFPLEK